MNIYAKSGTKIRYTNESISAERYVGNSDFPASKILTLGDTYTLEVAYAGDSTTEVFLKEFPGIRFNSVLFEEE